MSEKKTSVLSNGLIWFGAGVSIAEILTGTYLAPLGFGKGMLAILVGHVIGCVLLFFAGWMGARTKKSSMETAGMSFGNRGNILFAVLNVLQLVGWTGIMIYDGALAAEGVWSIGAWIWALVIGGLIVVWLLIGLSHLGKLNMIAMTLLFGLTVVLCFLIFRGDSSASVSEDLSFGAAVELSVAMPLSWFPLISDYTREAEKPFAATMVSAVTYGLVSTWMFVIGMGAAIFADTGDIAVIMVRAGVGVAGLFIIVFSTVTTTFLDAFSAGVSAISISKKIPARPFAIIVTVIGTVGAIFFPMDDITDFLYLIGSVFAPMIAVMLADYYILKEDSGEKKVNLISFFCWLAGFGLYRWLLHVDTPLGSTLPDMAMTLILTVVVKKIAGSVRRRNG
ncbi:MAG: putative hydroxymethylpyrimidine transporter CytX [Eubacterium sp.]|nr:putative hydroxymethylpyrimidine transporter CytX [Eubacterium sp.]